MKKEDIQEVANAYRLLEEQQAFMDGVELGLSENAEVIGMLNKALIEKDNEIGRLKGIVKMVWQDGLQIEAWEYFKLKNGL